MELRKEVEKEFWFQTISNATYSVDTFFFIRYDSPSMSFQLTQISTHHTYVNHFSFVLSLSIHLSNFFVAVFLCHTCISERMQKEN